MKNTRNILIVLLALGLGQSAWAQGIEETATDETQAVVENAAESTEAAAAEEAQAAAATTPEAAPLDLGNVSSSLKDQLDEAVAELNALREQIGNEKVPLTTRLGELETELRSVREEGAAAQREVANRQLTITNLNKKIDSRKKEANYLSGLLGDYLRNYEPRLHIAELQRYEKNLDAAKNAPDNSNLEQKEVFDIQIAAIQDSIDRLNESLGGTRFEGRAVDAGGEMKAGTFVMVGPTAIFRSDDGQLIGTAEQKLGVLVPEVVPFLDPESGATAAKVVADGSGRYPFDPTLGSARELAQVEDTFLEHVQKGGPVMYPIFGMAGLALLVALYKWMALTAIKKPRRSMIVKLCHEVERGDKDAAVAVAGKIGGPAGKMLEEGAKHIEEPRDLIEEIMYEQMLTTRLKVNRLLPFISICAAAAPLMGLLGTVTGIINTFKMITLYGTGDAESLSGGISEALITTKFGLIVAIPSLLIYAFLSRKAKGVIDEMEKSGIAFVNQLGKTPFKAPEPESPEPTDGDDDDDDDEKKTEYDEAA